MAFRPERAYRIADTRHPIWSGRGAAIHGGRWNTPGRLFIYCAETYSGARLELLVRLPMGIVPATHGIVTCDIPFDASLERFDVARYAAWKADRAFTQAYGDAWYDKQRSLLLLTPSVAAPGEVNIIVNETHREFTRLEPSPPSPVLWDARLFSR